MKIAVVVQGRFHAFDLARALADRGHDVTVFTNYPRWATRRFNLAAVRVQSFPVHGVIARVAGAVPGLARRLEPALHRAFGRWAMRRVAREPWDVVHCWSGVSEELLASRAAGKALTMLMRGSAHIATQRRLLDEEAVRVSRDLDHPSDWMVARERREYELADRIVVLSSFAAHTFVEEGTPVERIDVLPLGVDLDQFRPNDDVRIRRRTRIQTGEPLTVVYVGAISAQKGMWDLDAVVRTMSSRPMRFLLAGPLLDEARELLAALGNRVRYLGKLPQEDLPGVYAQGDIFLFPTIQDGFAVVLAQARAAGLPIITTTNSTGRDLVRDGVDGWVVGIRDPAAIVGHLEWCHDHRQALGEMTDRIGGDTATVTRDWHEVAADFDQLCDRLLVAGRGSATP